MWIHGLQKMTLLDFPGHVACTVFLGGCDLRCPFCHNYALADGTAKPVMTDRDFFAFLDTRRGLLDGVAITGGEPCLRPELPDFMRRIREAGFAVKLDTNGTHPDMLEQILRESLADYVAMDIKNSREKYARTAGMPGLEVDAVSRSIQLLLHGQTPFEFRTTVVGELHASEDFEQIGPWVQGAPLYFLQAFTDRESVPFAGFHAPDKKRMQAYASILSPYVGSVQLRGVD